MCSLQKADCTRHTNTYLHSCYIAATYTLHAMRMHCFFLAATACVVSLNAVAQWQWIDKDGRKVFSDRPPPAEIAEEHILKQPGGHRAKAAMAGASAAGASSVPTPAVAPTHAASAARPSGKDKALEKKKAQEEAEEAARQQAEQERVGSVRSDNCARARRAKTTYESGLRVAQTNDKGERVMVDDATRAAEIKRLQSIIDSNCN